MKKISIKIFFIVSLFVWPFISQAYQLYLTPGADLTISATPTNPGPYQNVTIKIKSYRFDLDHSFIAWQKDGKQTASNNGLKTFTFRTGPAGSQTVISLVINPKTGEGPIEAIITFSPIEIELLWQTDSYVPYWYRGKAQPSDKSQITVSAIARVKDSKGKDVPEQSLVYNWKKDGKLLPEASGVGKSNLTFKSGAIGTSNKIEVAISSDDRSISSSASTEIKSVEPKINFYEDRPLLGTVWQKSLNKEMTIGQQVIVRAEPFYFSDKNSLNFNWYVNNKPVAADELNPARLYLKAVNKNSSSRIGLRVSHPNYFLQEASNNLIIKSTSGGLF